MNEQPDVSALKVDAGFNIADPTTVPRLEGKVNVTEWEMRKQLAATYRLCSVYGWTDLVFTHISARLPDENGEHRFLINPYGVMFDEMNASCLVKIDMDCLLYTSPSPRDGLLSRMPSSA